VIANVGQKRVSDIKSHQKHERIGIFMVFIDLNTNHDPKKAQNGLKRSKIVENAPRSGRKFSITYHLTHCPAQRKKIFDSNTPYTVLHIESKPPFSVKNPGGRKKNPGGRKKNPGGRETPRPPGDLTPGRGVRHPVA